MGIRRPVGLLGFQPNLPVVSLFLHSAITTVSFVKTKPNHTHETCIQTIQTSSKASDNLKTFNQLKADIIVHTYDCTAKTRLITPTIITGLAALTYKKYNGIYAAKQQSAEHNIFHGVPLFSESCSIIAQSGS
mgnify:FL=1